MKKLALFLPICFLTSCQTSYFKVSRMYLRSNVLNTTSSAITVSIFENEYSFAPNSVVEIMLYEPLSSDENDKIRLKDLSSDEVTSFDWNLSLQLYDIFLTFYSQTNTEIDYIDFSFKYLSPDLVDEFFPFVLLNDDYYACFNNSEIKIKEFET